MAIHYSGPGLTLLLAASVLLPQTAFSAEGRRIEEVVVTAERRESTVQDTAISITAFNEELIEDFGLRNQEDLQNYIPATTIQPYDISIRGIGRVFRALGGDPGVATYFNGAYSEDFGIASTEGGLYDIDRIEVLRGPQGTLYGRNGIGGAVNFHTNKPTQEYSGEIRAVTGSFRTAELYGYLNGPIIKDVLAARFTGVHRERDGTIEDLSGAEPLDGYGDENYALALRWTPADNFTFDIRGNERSFRRIISSAQGAGAIVVSEAGGMRDEITGGKRHTSARVFGYRPVDTSVACSSLIDRTNPACTIPGQQVFTFAEGRTGQRVVSGVDPVADAFARPNFGFQADPALGNASTIGDGRSLPELDGDDLIVDTNGLNDESFDHQAGYIEAEWNATEWLSIKYIGAYTDYLYTRITDDDRTSNVTDMQFHANQENENFQHEVQFFIDVHPDVSITAGLFYYENQIDQRLDFWSDGLERFEGAANYGLGSVLEPNDPFLAWHTARAVYNTSDGADVDPTEVNPFTGAALGTDPTFPVWPGQVTWPLAKNRGCDLFFDTVGANLTDIVPVAAFADPHVKSVCFLEGPWLGETAGVNDVPSGPSTNGTSFIWDTENATEARAIYAQGEWQINPAWALTLGVRWAEDDKTANEHLFLYREEELTPDNLLAFNQATGALDAGGNPTGNEVIRFRGIPFSQSIYREIENKFDEVTWRANVDWTPVPDQLVYLSFTTGYRGGGFNLGFFSATPTYDPETLDAVELGYKGQLLDGTVQLNGSIYRYDYEDIHLQFVGQSFIGPSTSVRNHPGAVNQGFELEVMWLATDQLTLGGNYSYTDTEYDGELVDPETGLAGLVDTNDPSKPATIFSSVERTNFTDGNQLQRIPENKFAGWALYTIPLNTGTLDLLTSISWTDEVNFDITDSPLDLAQDFYRWDARATWTSDTRQVEISAFINNITDQIGIRNMDAEDESGNFLRSVVPTLPRMGGIEFRYRFGAF